MGLWDVDKIEYVGRQKGPQEGLAFHYYDADRVVAGKKMKDWLRFGVAWWHTFDQELVDPFGTGTAHRPWYGKYSNPLDEALAKVDYAFEFFTKLGVEYFCFHDRDIAPEGDTLRETNANLDKVVDKIEENMKATGVKLLWNTSSLFTNPRFVSGASTSPFADIYAYAGGQLKHSLEIAKRLGAENYVFWGGREGYENLWNTQMKREQEHMAKFFHMCHEYAKEIGLDAQFLIEPKAKEPTMHQYDFDAATAIAFLKTYDIDFMKLNLEGNHANLAGHTYQHEIRTAREAGVLGSLDANQGDKLIGWDMDEFPTDLMETTTVMWEVLDEGQIGPHGGLNFDAKPRRTSFARRTCSVRTSQAWTPSPPACWSPRRCTRTSSSRTCRPSATAPTTPASAPPSRTAPPRWPPWRSTPSTSRRPSSSRPPSRIIWSPSRPRSTTTSSTPSPRRDDSGPDLPGGPEDGEPVSAASAVRGGRHHSTIHILLSPFPSD